MIALFTILTVVFVIGRVVMGYYAGSVELIEILLPAVTWICIILGVVAGVFIGIRIFGEIIGIVSKPKHKDKEE